MSNERMGNNPATAEASRIFAATPPLTREQAAARLAEQGVLPPKDGGTLPSVKSPSYTAADYAGLQLHNAALPDDGDPAAILEGGRVLAESLQLAPTLAGAVVREIASAGDVSPDAVRTLVEKAGHSYDELLTLAGEALDRAALRLGKPLDIKPADLPAHSLVQIAVARRVQAKHEAQKR